MPFPRPFRAARLHRAAAGFGAQAAEADPFPRDLAPDVLPYALRVSLRLVRIAPGDRLTPISRYREQGRKAERPAPMSWAQYLSRVLNIESETCPADAGTVRIIARI